MKERLSVNRSVFKFKELYIGNNGYIFFILLLSLLKGIGLDTSRKIYWILSLSGLVIFILALLQEKCSFSEGQKMAGILLISVVTFYYSKGFGIFLLGVMIISLKDIRADDCLRMIEPVWIISIVSCVILSFVGITSNNVVEQFRLVGEVKARNSMGYSTANVFHETVVIGIILYCYNRKITFNKMLILVILNSLVYLLTYSSTALIIGTLAALGYMMIDNIKIRFNNKVIYYIITVGCFLPVLITFVSALIYNEKNQFLYSLNQLVTGRIYWNNLYLNNYPITLFGQPLNKEIGGFVDNAYCYTLLRYGLATFVFFVVMYVLVIKDCIKKRNMKKLYFCFLFLLYAFIEQFFQNCFMNYSLFFFGDIIWKERSIGRTGDYYEWR